MRGVCAVAEWACRGRGGAESTETKRCSVYAAGIAFSRADEVPDSVELPFAAGLVDSQLSSTVPCSREQGLCHRARCGEHIDVTVAKKYLREAEINELNRSVVMFLDFCRGRTPWKAALLTTELPGCT